MRYDVFVSYATKDAFVKDAVCTAFDGARIPYWVSQSGLRPGDQWTEGILTGMRDSCVCVLIFSSHANASPYVAREAQAAFDERKPIIPFCIEDVPLAEPLAFALAPSQFLWAFTPPLDAHVDRLVREVRRIVTAERSRENGRSARPTAVGDGGYRTLPSRKQAALELLARGDHASAVRQLELCMTSDPADPVLHLAMAIGCAGGIPIDQLARSHAMHIHRHLALAFADARTRGAAAVALLALQIDFFTWNGISPPPPSRDDLVRAVMKADLATPALFQLLGRLNMTRATRARLGL